MIHHQLFATHNTDAMFTLALAFSAILNNNSG